MKEEKESIDVNDIDGNIVLLTHLFTHLNDLHWKEEINSNGASFDYDSQDIYRHLFEDMLLKLEIIEKISPETDKNERKELLVDLKKSVEKNINIYYKYNEFFKDLPRKKLMIDEFNKRILKKNNLNDEEINYRLNLIKVQYTRKKYFDSDLYNNIGFLFISVRQKYRID